MVRMFKNRCCCIPVFPQAFGMIHQPSSIFDEEGVYSFLTFSIVLFSY